MKRILFILLIQGPICSYSQSENRRVEIGINFCPDICYRTLKNNDGSANTDAIISQRNKNETFKVGYTGGLNLCFNIKRFLGLEVGVNYSNKGYQTQPINLISWQSTGNDPTQVVFIYNIHYMDIPAKINFTIGKRKLRFIANAGIAANIFMNETQTRVFEYIDGRRDKQTNPTTTNYKRISISPIVGLGIDYKINNRMKLRIEPMIKYGIIPIIDAPVTGYLYSGGLNISYYFGL